MTMALSMAFMLMHVRSDWLKDLSFEGPFRDVDSGGKRVIGNGFKYFGNTVVNSNFIRLTPDRQSKKGAVWSKGKTNRAEMTAMLKFRISGQAKTFFGDGIALWFTNQGMWTEGDFHGSQETFKGVAVILDTFKNTEYAYAHRDVTVLINDGSKTYEMMTDDITGCDVDVRYHNARADFSVLDASRLLVRFSDDGKKISIETDAKNSGNWLECVKNIDLPFDQGWLKESYIGITASTGSLADNHDVLEFKAWDSYAEAEVEKMKKDKLASGSGTEMDEDTSKFTDDERLSLLEEKLSAGLKRFADFDLHLEHELASVSEHVEHMIRQIEARENKAEIRLEEIEEVCVYYYDVVVVVVDFYCFILYCIVWYCMVVEYIYKYERKGM